MSWGYRRRGNPYARAKAEERRERERRDEQIIERGRARLRRLLSQFRLVLVKGEESNAAWGGESLRHFSVGKTSSGDWVTETVRRANGRLYLQRASYPGWNFYRLEPRYHVPRAEWLDERDRSRRGR